MKLAKWGNSLAIRIPAPLVLELGLKEGDDIQVVRNPDGALAIASTDFDERRQRAIEWMRTSQRGISTHLLESYLAGEFNDPPPPQFPPLNE